MLDELIKLFGWSRATFFKWKREGRGIIKLIDKYFDEGMIHEFNTTGKIERLENLKKMDDVVDTIIEEMDEFAFTNAMYKISSISSEKTKEIIVKIIKKIAIDKNQIKNFKIHLIDNLKAVEATLDRDYKISDFVYQYLSFIEVEALIKNYNHIQYKKDK